MGTACLESYGATGAQFARMLHDGKPNLFGCGKPATLGLVLRRDCDAPGPRRLRRLMAPAWALLAILGLTGCYGPYYNQPYGYPAGPGTPVYPGTPVGPNGTPQLGTPTYDNNASPGGDAPFYGSESTNSTGNRPVPDANYDDAATSPYFDEPGGAAASSSPDVLGSNPGVGTSTPSTPTGGASDFERPFGDGADASDDDFQEPIPGVEPISFEREVSAVTKLPYAYDVAGHRWVQGMVSYDPQDRSWGIIYSIDPDQADPYAGYLTLASDPRLSSLKDGDVVRLEGRIDPARADHLGRPMYVVAKIKPMSL